MPTFHDLQTYRECPRKFAYSCVMGYSKPVIAPAMTTGILVHAGIAAHLRNEKYREVMERQMLQQVDLIAQYVDDASKHGDELRSLAKAYERALSLADRYIHAWLLDYMPVLMVEPELKLGDVVCHPDMIIQYHGHVTIVDYKTSKSPDPR